jgi:hypothetical protein
LRDEYTNPEGRRHVEQAPASLMGEPLSDTDRYRLSGDHSPEYLDSLLASLESGSAAAPNALLQFVEDPRVRPALAAAARRAPARDLANFAQAIALAGGEGAVAVLRDRLHELHTQEAFADDPFFNPVTGSLVTVAGGLLRFGSDQREAATALAAVVREHPCAFNRRSAAYQICDSLEYALSADTKRTLEGVLLEQLATDDPEMFAVVAPPLARARLDQVFARCGELLRDPSSEVRVCVTRALQKMEDPRARALLLEHLPREPWLRSMVQIAAYLRGDVPAALRADIAKQALADDSPSLRRGGATLLRDLDADSARGLAEAALVDEPDPLVRKCLEEHVA